MLLVVAKCANPVCSAPHAANDGRLFRLDLDIGNSAGEIQRKTMYIWLCSRCARQMSPKVTVKRNSVLIGLALTCHKATGSDLPARRVN